MATATSILIVANECGSLNGFGGCAGETGALGVLLGNGDGTFQPATSYNSGGDLANSVAISDVNRDGKPDLVVANWDAGGYSGDGNVSVLLGNSDGTFQPAVTYGTGAYGSAFQVAAADVNGDGKPDLVVASWSSQSYSNLCPEIGGVSVLLGNGDGSFQPAVTYGTGGYIDGSVAIADVNGDGRPDLIVANVGCKDRHRHPYDSNSVGVLLNNSGAPPTTTTLVSSVNPVALKQEVTYTATVTSQAGGTLTGTVTFKDGGTPIANVTLTNNQAVYSTSYTKKGLGAHAITAWYWGELNTAEGDESAPLTEYALTPTSTETQVTTSGSPSLVDQPVTFTAVVTSSYGAPPDGELVTFDDGKTVLGSVALAGGTAVYTTSTLPVGINTIKAVYAGDAVYRRSTGKLKQVVNKCETTSSVSSSLNPSQSGQAVTFTAQVTSAGPTPTGTVKFMDGTKALGSATLSGGLATLTTSKLAVGTHPITAEYLGDADNAKSTSPVLEQVVQ